MWRSDADTDAGRKSDTDAGSIANTNAGRSVLAFFAKLVRH